jgi:hypothetical protein
VEMKHVVESDSGLIQNFEDAVGEMEGESVYC